MRFIFNVTDLFTHIFELVQENEILSFFLIAALFILLVYLLISQIRRFGRF